MKTWKSISPGLRNKIIIKKSVIRFNLLKLSIFRRRAVFNKYLKINYYLSYFLCNASIFGFQKHIYNSNNLIILQNNNNLYQIILSTFNISIGQTLNLFKKNIYNIFQLNFLKFSLPQRIYHSLIFINIVKIARSAGCFIKLIGNLKNNLSVVIYPSKIKLTINSYSIAFTGRADNVKYKSEKYGKAGYMKYFFYKPTTRGEVKNAVDHPHGGRTQKGKPKHSPWGWIIH